MKDRMNDPAAKNLSMLDRINLKQCLPPMAPTSHKTWKVACTFCLCCVSPDWAHKRDIARRPGMMFASRQKQPGLYKEEAIEFDRIIPPPDATARDFRSIPSRHCILAASLAWTSPAAALLPAWPRHTLIRSAGCSQGVATAACAPVQGSLEKRCRNVSTDVESWNEAAMAAKRGLRTRDNL